MPLSPLVEPVADLSPQEVARYSRHLLIPDFGLLGQKRLKSSKVLAIGAGGLGSPTLLYLAAAGIGTLGIIDFDRVEESNLQRQIIHGVTDIGRPKTESAKDAIKELNPYVEVCLHDERLDNHNVMEIFSHYDLIVDGTDNFATRYLVNDACVLLGKPYVWGSIFRLEGQASVFWEAAPDGRGLNYRDLYPAPPPPELAPSCSEGGVLGILCASIASVMATEAVKLITGIGEPLLGRLLIYDALAMDYRCLPLHQAPERFEIKKLLDYEFFCGLNTRSQSIEEVPSISAAELKQLQNSNTVFQLIDVREQTERDIVCIEGAQHIPKAEIMLGHGLEGLNKDLYTVVHCKLGGRSRDALIQLQKLGFSQVKNLTGGILAWVDEVDPSLPKY